MNQKKFLLWKKYVMERRKVIFTFFGVNLIYSVLHLLYQLPSEIIQYGLLLNVSIAIIPTMIDYYFYQKKCQELHMLLNSIEVQPITVVKAEGGIEEAYQQLITCLKEQLSKVTLESDERLSNQMEYLTMWTHQIKTPVAALRLLTTNLPQSKERDAIKQELFRIEEYIGMVLQYLRIDSMSSDLLLKQYDLYSIVKQAVKKYSILFIQKHLSLQLEEFDCKVITDEKWIVFVIEQILSNALKYTNEGSICIYLEGEKQLVIEDTGIGIRQEDMKRVFERGYTGYNGRLDKKSTGIGMYLCKNILDRLGHQIRIESKLSVGTKVILDLKSYQLSLM